MNNISCHLLLFWTSCLYVPD